MNKGVKRRILITAALKSKSMTSKQLEAQLGYAQTTVSGDLRWLCSDGIIKPCDIDDMVNGVIYEAVA